MPGRQEWANIDVKVIWLSTVGGLQPNFIPRPAAGHWPWGFGHPGGSLGAVERRTIVLGSVQVEMEVSKACSWFRGRRNALG
jgi:hypothetical protein